MKIFIIVCGMTLFLTASSSAGTYEDDSIKVVQIMKEYYSKIDTIPVLDIPSMLDNFLRVAYMNYHLVVSGIMTERESPGATELINAEQFYRGSQLIAESHYSLSTDCIKRIKNINNAKLYDMLLDYYAIVSEIRDLAHNPNGAYETYLIRVTKLESEEAKLSSKLNIILDSNSSKSIHGSNKK